MMCGLTEGAMGSKLLLGIPVLPSLDIGRTLVFYESKLGFKRHIESDDYAGVERDGVQIHFWLCRDAEIPANSSCRINVSGVDALHAACAAEGIVHEKGGLAPKPWGFREFSVVDPDRNLVVLAEEIPGWVEE